MKTLFLTFFLLPTFVLAQQSTHNFMFDGANRKYIQYVPASYDGSEAVPVIFALHGLGDNMNNFSNVGFHQVADTANFIVITPEALVSPLVNATAWNSGAGVGPFILNENVDDVGFISAVLDSLTRHFNIDPTRIFATGFSMGGFMSNRLACELNDRIAAIASVAGTIGLGIDCQPARAIPVCHFHGTADATVAYEGNQFGNDAEDLFDFWSTNNNCDATIDSVQIANTVADGISITKITRKSNCTNNAETVLFRADSANHNWLYIPANDIDYTSEIWKFFSDKTHPNPSLTHLVELSDSPKLYLFPNPANNTLNINLTNYHTSTAQVVIYNVLAEKIITQTVNTSTNKQLDISNLPCGSYIAQIIMGETVFSQVFIKEQ